MKDTILKAWCALQTDRRGVTAVEYAVIAGLVIAAIAGAFTTLATDISTKIGDISALL